MMSLTDEEFREEYKPIQVPARYDNAEALQNKMIFALAQVGDGTAEDVIAEMDKLEPGIADEQSRLFVSTTLASLYGHGHITGTEKNGRMHYNLSKITQANDGATNPDLLAPGMD